MRERKATGRRRWLLVALVAIGAGMVTAPATAPATARAARRPPMASASGFLTYKFPIGQPTCTGIGLNAAPSLAFDRNDCGFVSFSLAPPPEIDGVVGKAKLYRPGTTDVFAEPEVLWDTTDGSAQFSIDPGPTWPAGEIAYQIFLADDPAPAGGAFFRHNFLGADVAVTAKADGTPYRPGDALPITGSLYELNRTGASDQKTAVSGTYSLRLSTGLGATTFGPFTANVPGVGGIAATIPGSMTAGLVGLPENGFRTSVTVEVVAASFQDASTGRWESAVAGSTPIPLLGLPTSLVVENSYVSPVGWVKPGEAYPFRVLVKNFRAVTATGGVVTIPAVDGATFTRVTPTSGGSATVRDDGSIEWKLDDMAAAGASGPALETLVVEARADTTGDDPTIVWKNLSTTATLTYEGGPAGLRSTSKGPKVIPPSEAYDTARYGDRPFPVVPVDYADRPHDPSHSGDRLTTVVNSPEFPGSTFNLYQEMSLGQLFPHGTVPSAGVAKAAFAPGADFGFTTLEPSGTCRGGVTLAAATGSPLYPDRIVDGWYQLPGNTDYYGDDQVGSEGYNAQAGARIGDVDNACGPRPKAVYDAAAIADPDIDYSDYDTDKDGVVDFFMMVFAGVGGHGQSQFEVPPYDNIWPHSSSLEFEYTSPEGGGYVSDDQLKDLEGRPLYWTDTTRTTMTTTKTATPVRVRVGPYNVNPEDAVDRASVISHEYGHSLGLPDFYSTGSRATYGDWNLMATDKSQHMDVFSRQELGWIVPRVLPPGTTTITGWKDSKVNTRRIDWVAPDGTPYVLEGPDVNNAEAYVAKLPGRVVIDPKKIQSQASATHVWWSTAGDNYGCPGTAKGRSLDVYLPELGDVPAGTPVNVSFKSLWDIEWDYDHGFLLYSTDGGSTFASLPSRNGYTTASDNPQNSACQTKYGNGLTGSSGSYARGTDAIDRTGAGELTGALSPYPESVFLDDSFDLTPAAGKSTVLRFAYTSDAGLARPGWFIDDLKVTVGNRVLYSSNFEDADDPRLFPGGCRESIRVAEVCTRTWQRIEASTGSAFDHGYYLEMRDRSGFDFDGRGQNDRDPIAFDPGVLLVYTDESHGYGNVGVEDPPAQTPLDSQPEPLSEEPDLADAAYTAATGDRRFTDSGDGHVDNYSVPSQSATGDPVEWRFRHNCLTFEVLRMSGDTGNATGARDLEGDVRFDLASGCAPFDYGYVGAAGASRSAPQTAAAAPAASQLPPTGGTDAALLGGGLLAAAAAVQRMRGQRTGR